MFLDVIPKELKTEIMKDAQLQFCSHRALADWCKARTLILHRKQLAEIAKKNLACTYGGQIKSSKSTSPDAESDSKDDVPQWFAKYIASQQPIAAVRPPSPSGGRREQPDRGRNARRDDRNGRGRNGSDRSSSRGRKFA